MTRPIDFTISALVVLAGAVVPIGVAAAWGFNDPVWLLLSAISLALFLS